MSSEENYLDNLLNNILNPKAAEPITVQTDNIVENGIVENIEKSEEESVMEEPVITGETADEEVPVFPDAPVLSGEDPVLMEEISIDSFEMPEMPDLEIPDLEIPDLEFSDLELSDIAMPGEEFGIADIETAEEVQSVDALALEETGISDMDAAWEPQAEEVLALEETEVLSMAAELQLEEIPVMEEMENPYMEPLEERQPEEILPVAEEMETSCMELSEEQQFEEMPMLEEMENLSMELSEEQQLEGMPMLEEMENLSMELSEEQRLEEMPMLEEMGNSYMELSEEQQPEEIPVMQEAEVFDMETAIPQFEEEPITVPFEPHVPDIEDLERKEIEVPDMEISDEEIPDIGEELGLEDIEMPGLGDELKLEDIEIPEMLNEEPFQEVELSIDGLDEAIQSETELQMAGELNIDELEFDNISLEAGGADSNIPDLDLPADLLDDNDVSMGMDDNLEDVLNMLDDDAELAEINDMLKKSDNNEPIQDDMMDLLHQMADDEAASVNAGIKTADDEDDGVALPEISQFVSNADQVEEAAADKTKKKGKKAAAKKKKGDSAEPKISAENTKEPGKLGKFLNLLTEDLVPEPTEEELAAEKEAKEAKKKENLTKKEAEKLAKEEAKKAKAEEKAAANQEKQAAAAQKKKEKMEKKAAREAEKRAKLAAEGHKKKISPKKIAAVAVFGASVGGAVIVSTNILATQGFLQTARNAYYDKDYKTVYQSTFGMELDDSESDGLIKARSEVIFKIQRRYDSYQTNLKMGREVEALDALLQGIVVYDSVNADAEKYDVMAEVDAVRTDILNTLEERYGLDEAGARAIISTEDALSYTIALNDVIAGK